MHMLLSIAVVVATVCGTEWLVDGWLGEDRRFWIGLAGVALMFLAGVLVKASGINEIVRLVRGAVIGAGVDAVRRRLGMRSTEGGTDVEAKRATALRWSWASGWLLNLGWVGTLIGTGMIWTGFFAR